MCMSEGRFLVLEDEPLIAMDLHFAFEDAGCEAVTANTNREAEALIDKFPIIGAILDVSLAAKKTCDATARLLHERAIPFVLHTGDLDRVGEHLRDLDAPIIPKPQSADDVVARLLALVKKND